MTVQSLTTFDTYVKIKLQKIVGNLLDFTPQIGRTLDSLKRVFNAFRRKPSLRAPEVFSWHSGECMNLENEIQETYVLSLELVLNPCIR